MYFIPSWKYVSIFLGGAMYIYIDKSDHELTDITRMMKSRALILGSAKPWTFGPWIWIAAIRAMKLNKSSLGCRRFTIMNHKLGWMMMDFYCGSQMLQMLIQMVRGIGQAFQSPQCARPWDLWASMRLGEIDRSRPWYGENMWKLRITCKWMFIIYPTHDTI